MRIQIDFILDNDKQNKYYDMIHNRFIKQYKWYEDDYTDSVVADIPGIKNNAEAIEYGKKLFMDIVQAISDESNSIIFVKNLTICVNFIARNVVPGQPIECGEMPEYKDIRVHPKTINHA